MSRPEPRPALQRAEDGLVHPAAPRVSPERHLHPAPHAPAAETRPQADARPTADHASSAESDAADSTFTGKPAKLDVQIPKDLRKEVRRLAERSDLSVDAVVSDALARYITHRG